MAKEIRLIELEVGELKFGFQNPRKVTTQKLEELEASLNNLGDFGLFVIDEEKNVIGGNQRAKTLQKKDPHIMVTCKMLIGYTDEEKRAIAIMDNEHAGTWELEGLAAWTADLNLALGINTDKKQDLDQHTVDGMDPIHYEKYDYVIIACRFEADYLNLIRALGIEGKKVKVCKTRSIKARAIWYDQIKPKIAAMLGLMPGEETEE